MLVSVDVLPLDYDVLTMLLDDCAFPVFSAVILFTILLDVFVSASEMVFVFTSLFVSAPVRDAAL